MLGRIRRLTRRDELSPLERKIAAERLPIPEAAPPARSWPRSGLLRHKAAQAAAVAAAGATLFFAGVWYEDQRQDAAREAELRQQWNAAAAETGALARAYNLAHQEELRQRGLQPPRDNFFAALEYYADHPPRDPSVLAVKDELEAAEARQDALSRRLFN
jgi:hypothetical protein